MVGVGDWLEVGFEIRFQIQIRVRDWWGAIICENRTYEGGTKEDHIDPL